MTRIPWKKTFIIVIDLVLAGYLIMAFGAFDKRFDDRAVCEKVDINISDGATNGFISAKEVKHRLIAERLYPLGRPMRYVDARKIENVLKSSPFIRTAECYKTNSGKVDITVTQLMPVIRVKADNGDDYYVDDKNKIMPNTHYTSDLIIATGNISRHFATRSLAPFGKAVMGNDLWKNLIEQINVTPDGGIEIVPRVGDHIVYLGHLPDPRRGVWRDKQVADFVDKKMARLDKFYKYGLSQAGWNKYSYINLEFDNQIICRRRDLHRPKTEAKPSDTDMTVETGNAAESEPSAQANAESEAREKRESRGKIDEPSRIVSRNPEMSDTEHSRRKSMTSERKDKKRSPKETKKKLR